MNTKENISEELSETAKKAIDLLMTTRNKCLDLYELNGDDFEEWPVKDLPYAAIKPLLDMITAAQFAKDQQDGCSPDYTPPSIPLHRLLSPEHGKFLPIFEKICQVFADLPDDQYDWHGFWRLGKFGMNAAFSLDKITTDLGVKSLPDYHRFWDVTYPKLFCNLESEAKPRPSREDLAKAYATLKDLFGILAHEAEIQFTMVGRREDQKLQGIDASQAINATDLKAIDKRLSNIEEAVLDINLHTTNQANRVISETKPNPPKYGYAIELAVKLYKKDKRFWTWPKTVKAIRDMKDKNDPLFKQCAKARSSVKKDAKQVCGGEDMAWRTVKQKAKERYATTKKVNKPTPKFGSFATWNTESSYK